MITESTFLSFSGQLLLKEKEVEDLKSRVAEVMAVMPATGTGSPGGVTPVTSFSSFLSPSPPLSTSTGGAYASSLDPNACIYTPKLTNCLGLDTED